MSFLLEEATATETAGEVRPRMSIVVITYQSAAMLPALWRSLAPQLPELGRTELYLIDNASSDDSRHVLRDIVDESSRDSTNGSRVELRANRQNLGFARACNQALARATGRYSSPSSSHARMA